MSKIIDITREIFTGMPVYTGNPQVKIEEIAKMPESSTNLSLITMGSHTGTHVDAPKHIKNNGKGVNKIRLESCYGNCKVLDLSKKKESVTEKDLKKYKLKKGEIVLLKTKNSKMQFKKFDSKYVYLSLDAAKYLREKKVKAVGIDYLSVQKYHSGNQKVHKTLLENNIIVFEGLNLKNVKKGKYFFVGLPLKIRNCDGSPARCILLKK